MTATVDYKITIHTPAPFRLILTDKLQHEYLDFKVYRRERVALNNNRRYVEELVNKAKNSQTPKDFASFYKEADDLYTSDIRASLDYLEMYSEQITVANKFLPSLAKHYDILNVGVANNAIELFVFIDIDQYQQFKKQFNSYVTDQESSQTFKDNAKKGYFIVRLTPDNNLLHHVPAQYREAFTFYFADDNTTLTNKAVSKIGGRATYVTATDCYLTNKKNNTFLKCK